MNGIRPPDQSVYDVRVEWGSDGLSGLLAASDVVVVVDVLSFSTCVDVAVARGAFVLPFPSQGDAALAHARKINARCVVARGKGRFSLSPLTFATVEAGERVVLPSLNGAALSLQTGVVLTLTACLRNATAVARAAERLGRRITVVPAGERWPSGALRPAIEDWVGAGAVVAALGGLQSPEAALARSTFETVAPRLESVLSECSSGRELIDRGYQDDVTWASALDVSQSVPILRQGAFSSLPPVMPAA